MAFWAISEHNEENVKPHWPSFGDVCKIEYVTEVLTEARFAL